MAQQQAIKEAGAAMDLSQHTPSLVRYQDMLPFHLMIPLNTQNNHLNLKFLQAGSVLECPDGHGGSLLIRIQNMACTGK